MIDLETLFSRLYLGQLVEFFLEHLFELLAEFAVLPALLGSHPIGFLLEEYPLLGGSVVVEVEPLLALPLSVLLEPLGRLPRTAQILE